MLRILTIASLLLLAAPLAAQDAQWINYSIANGLPSNETYSIFQDKQGFLWFCTDNGVTRFDGESFQTFGVQQGLTDPVVFGIFQDHKDRLWFRTYSGKLCYYENGRIHPYQFNDRIKNIAQNLVIYRLYVDEQDNLWFSGNWRALFHISNQGKLSIDTLAGEPVIYKSFGEKDYITGIGSYRPSSFMLDGKSFPLSVSDITMQNRLVFAQRRDGKLILGVNNDLFSYDGVNPPQRVYTGPYMITNLSVDSHDNLWVGYLYNGVECLDRKYRKTRDIPFLRNKSVTHTLQDHEGGYWFATLEDGVYYVPNMSVQVYPTLAGKKDNLGDENQHQHDPGWRPVGMEFAPLKTPEAQEWEGKFPTTVLKLYQDRSNQIWVAHKWLEVFDTDFKKIRDVWSHQKRLREDKEGNLWCIGGGRYLGKYSLKGDILMHRAEDIYRSIYVHDSLLFLAKRTGLLVRSLNNLNNIIELQQLRDYKIVEIRPVAHDVVNALYKRQRLCAAGLQDPGHTQIRHGQPLLWPTRFFSTCQNDTSLWLGTENGLVISS